MHASCENALSRRAGARAPVARRRGRLRRVNRHGGRCRRGAARRIDARHRRVLPDARADHRAPDRRMRVRHHGDRGRLAGCAARESLRAGRRRDRRRRCGALRLDALARMDAAQSSDARVRRLAARARRGPAAAIALGRRRARSVRPVPLRRRGDPLSRRRRSRAGRARAATLRGARPRARARCLRPRGRRRRAAHRDGRRARATAAIARARGGVSRA
ncbi:Uncharacterised protein [Burkholderia pseudomallei]|nr:Uncharacterised protein [Burkholderia pseudomallei]